MTVGGIVAKTVFLFALVLAGCVSLQSGYYGDNVDGRSVERSIDSVIGGYLRLRDPHLLVEPSRCPDRIDVSQGRTASCTLVIDHVPLLVRVIYGGPPQQFSAKLPDYFFERRTVEQFAETELLKHGVKVRVGCSGAAVSIMEPGTRFTCRMVGDTTAKPITMNVGDHGRLTFPSIAGLRRSQFDKTLFYIMNRHQSGAPTLVAGSFLAEYIDQSISEDRQASPVAGPKFGSVRCPDSVDLTGRKRGICLVSVAGRDLHIGVWISSRTLVSQPLDAVIDMHFVQAQAEASINQALAEHGFSTVVKIDCKPGYFVMPVPSQFYCKAMLGTEARKLMVDVKDYRGNIQSKII